MFSAGVLSLLFLVVAELSLSVSGQGVTYGDVLHNILTGNITNYEDSFGVIEYYSEQPFSATANISIASIDNAEVLNGTIQLYEWATFGQKWGDAVFLNLFMKYNGQANNYLESDDLKRDLIKLADGNDTLFRIWAESSSDEDLSNLYQSLHKGE
ncbi:hypothetical protein HG536_0H00120 [Torulaspora globosa]|uniref:WD-like domain-containing protein n=1 Tax=Torulaspora globosa TaxID=48254 RepID=A0A7G3ZMA2_9SACH|nr:uncharacterized protein HG536_0H00120 [Torulaspora globosa]QLL34638.1 hypothetical protein HG536_0H00120 [Torulaspora globosa]